MKLPNKNLLVLLVIAPVAGAQIQLTPGDLLPPGDDTWNTDVFGHVATVTFELLEEVTPWASVNCVYLDVQDDGWSAGGAVVGLPTNDVLVFDGAEGIAALHTRALPSGVNLSLLNDVGPLTGALDAADSYLNTNPALARVDPPTSQFFKYFLADPNRSYVFGSTFLGTGFHAFVFIDNDRNGPRMDFNDMILGIRCVSGPERCDEKDNDCDGGVDEDFPDLGQPCSVGVGVCESFGHIECTPDGTGTQCDAVPGVPSPETCNGLDDDCDGSVDEDFPDLGQPCSVGIGVCESFGLTECTPDGTGTQCDAVPGVPSPETCNGLDDDCDGSVDEDFPGLGSSCTQGLGACERAGTTVCTPDGSSTQCSAMPGQPAPETCNGLDDDCDGSVDEDFPNLGSSCTQGLGVCERTGTTVCTADGSGTQCSAMPGQPVPETCNGLDDDCDGSVDEDFPGVGNGCSIGSGECEAFGTIVCTADGSAAECDATQCTILAEDTVAAGTPDHVASVTEGGVGALFQWTVAGGIVTAGQGTSSILYRVGPGPTLAIDVAITEASGCVKRCNQEVTVLFPDCDNNGTPDFVEITNCPGRADCDDCNLNGVPDGCDVADGTSQDTDGDGVPDECLPPPPVGGNWSDDIWGLVANNPFPDNVNGVPDLHVTIDGVDLFLDVSVDIDTLRLLNGAVLRITQLTQGDLSLAQAGGISCEGLIFVDHDRRIDVGSGAVVLGQGCKYTAAPAPRRAGSNSAGGGIVNATLAADQIILLPTFCGETEQMTLSGMMTVATTGDFIIDGTGVNPCPCTGLCPFRDGKMNTPLGGQTPGILRLEKPIPFSNSLHRQSANPFEFTLMNIGGAFRLLESAIVCIGCDDPLSDAVPRMVLQGDFDNESLFPSLFNFVDGSLLLNGAGPQAFEVAGVDLGPTVDGFGTAGDTNFAMGKIVVASTAAVTFENRHTNTVAAGPCAEALYVKTLTLGPGSTLTLDDVHVYYLTLEDNGATINTNGCGALLNACVSDPPVTAVVAKNRYLSFSTVRAGAPTAIRVTFKDLPSPFDVQDAATMWVGQPQDVSVVSGSPGRDPLFANLKVSTLQCKPFYMDWSTIPVIHVFHGSIVPQGVYELQTLIQGCQTTDENSFSPASAQIMSRWGDVVGSFVGGTWNAPDGAVDFVRDAIAMVDSFANLGPAPSKVRSDLEPATPDQMVTILDLVAVVQAFKGQPFPHSPGPAPCP